MHQRLQVQRLYLITFQRKFQSVNVSCERQSLTLLRAATQTIISIPASLKSHLLDLYTYPMLNDHVLSLELLYCIFAAI